MSTIAEAADHLFINERTFKRHLDERNISRRGRGLTDAGEVQSVLSDAVNEALHRLATTIVVSLPTDSKTQSH